MAQSLIHIGGYSRTIEINHYISTGAEYNLVDRKCIKCGHILEKLCFGEVCLYLSTRIHQPDIFCFALMKNLNRLSGNEHVSGRPVLWDNKVRFDTCIKVCINCAGFDSKSIFSWPWESLNSFSFRWFNSQKCVVWFWSEIIKSFLNLLRLSTSEVFCPWFMFVALFVLDLFLLIWLNFISIN